jgi:hypothetical protein
MPFKVQVYVPHGYFEYEVSRMDQAIDHGQQIMQRGVYRRPLPDGSGLELWQVYKVKIIGEGMGSQYSDTFRRT